MEITKDIRYVGVNDHDVDLFEGQYVVPNGMTYNSYVILDEKIAVMDTVDAQFAVDGLRLASLNTPDALSNSLGVVGGLLLSEFAVKAGWFSGEAILITAFTAIAGFSLPSFEMGYAMKLERLLLLILSGIFGLWGFIGGLVFIIICMLSVKTLSGRNYLYPIVPFNLKGFAEFFLRFPMK